MLNTIGHVELDVTGIPAAEKFYGDLFGWTFQKWADDYSLFNVEGGIGGGLHKVDAPRGDGPVRFYVGVEDIPATLDRVTAGGGKTEKPKTEIGGGMGFFALFRDPSGNLVGLWSAK